jgi:hypothetical protein
MKRYWIDIYILIGVKFVVMETNSVWLEVFLVIVICIEYNSEGGVVEWIYISMDINNSTKLNGTLTTM